MLSDLLIARSALGRSGPDLSRHAAMQCTFSRFKSSLAKLAQRIVRQLTTVGTRQA